MKDKNIIENQDNTEKKKIGIFDDKVVRYASFFMLIICVFAIAWLSFQVVLLSQFMYNKDSRMNDKQYILEIIDEIDSLFEAKYIGEIGDNSLNKELAIQGYTLGFEDKYGYYYSPEDAQAASDDRAEKLVGIGVETVRENDKGYYIVRTMSNSPAEEGGLRAGDYIVEADGVSAKDVENSDFVNMIRGPEGTTVDVKISNGDNLDDLRDVTITRREVVNESVIGSMSGDIAIVKIKSFTEKTDEEYIAIMDKFKEEGVEKFVIDLRDNTGGLAESVIAILDYMLPEGLIAKFVEKDESNVTEYTSDSNEYTGEFVILTNQSTASASELFCKAMKDYNKAITVGTNTFGKGTVLSTYALSNGGTVTLSTAKYYTISNEDLEDVGIAPDIEVELTDEQVKTSYKLKPTEDAQMIAAMDYLNNIE